MFARPLLFAYWKVSTSKISIFYLVSVAEQATSFTSLSKNIHEHNFSDERYVVDRHRCHMTAKFGVFVDEDHSKLPTLCWLPKLHSRPYKSQLLLILSHVLLLSCL